MTTKKISTNYKRDDIKKEIKNYITIWNELLDAKTDIQFKKALVKSVINSDCLLYTYRQYNPDDALKNVFFLEDDIKKSFSSNSVKYIRAHIITETYSVGYINNSIDNFVAEKTNVYDNNNKQESICKDHTDTEILFQKLFHNSEFKKMYNNLKL